MKLEIYNKEKKPDGSITVSDAVFGAAWKPDLVHKAITAYYANKRNSVAQTKDRSEVRGGGKKPWRQKHTGHARHGSRRSPIWSGGGITFGPRNDKDFSKKISKKARKAALFSVISKKRSDSELFVINNFDFELPKTKSAAQFLDKFFGKNKKSVLLIKSAEDKNIFRLSKNIQGVNVISAESLNVYDCALKKYIVFEKAAAERMK